MSCRPAACYAQLPSIPTPRRWGTYLFFAAVLVLNTAFVCWLVPETRDVPQEDM